MNDELVASFLPDGWELVKAETEWQPKRATLPQGRMWLSMPQWIDYAPIDKCVRVDYGWKDTLNDEIQYWGFRLGATSLEARTKALQSVRDSMDSPVCSVWAECMIPMQIDEPIRHGVFTAVSA